MKKVAISQSNYIPWKGYFDIINSVDEFVLYDDMQYTRRDWRNRNLIKTREGLQWLTIPVDVKGKYHQKINETKVSDPTWNRSHWTSIEHNYARAAHFRNYRDLLAELYLTTSSQYLSEINRRFLEGLCALLSIRTRFTWSSEYQMEDDRTARLVGICRQLAATHYYTGPAARAYMDESLFREAGIEIVYYDYSGYPEYRQLFPPFEHGVTILDLLFNEGSKASAFMKSFVR
jgi:hypothetical protein